jgi:O-antigen/teichoic acid export membrane protein
VTRVLGLVLFINAFAIIQRTILVKKIDFKTQTIITLMSSVPSGLVGIGMAFNGFGVWSLVGQQLSQQGLNTTFLWIFNRWFPTWQFSVISFKKLFSFGSKLLVAGLIDTIWQDIYYVVIGKVYSATTLGYYTRARQYESLFSSNLSSVIQGVSFPVLSSIQDDNVRLKEGYRRIIRITMLVTFTCMLGLAAVAKPLIILMIGKKWLASVYFLQILCFLECSTPFMR